MEIWRISLILFVLSLSAIITIRYKGLHINHNEGCDYKYPFLEKIVNSFVKLVFQKDKNCVMVFKKSFIYRFGSSVEFILLNMEHCFVHSFYSFIHFIAFGGWKSILFVFTLGMLLLGACFMLWRRLIHDQRSEIQNDRTENLRRNESRSRSGSRTRNRNTGGAQDETSCLTLSSNRVLSQEHYESFRYSLMFHRWIRSCLMIVMILLSLSIPWEFIRMYQDAVARRAAVMQQGMPPECFPHQMTILQTLKSFLLRLISWNYDPCDKYHRLILIDPIWDVNPSKVLTNCFLYPFEMLSSTIGQSLKHIFEVIPSQLQIFFIGLLGLVVVMVIVMSCGYRIRSFFVSFEPPNFIRTRELNNGSQKNRAIVIS